MTIPARPEVTEEMVREAATTVAPSLNPATDSDKESLIESIVRQYSHPMDGYELARDLDKWESWRCTRDDMEELDRVESVVRGLLKKSEKAWFDENDIQPPFPIRTEIQEGVIKGISQHSIAVYEVQENGCPDPNRSLLVKFEDAAPVDPVA